MHFGSWRRRKEYSEFKRFKILKHLSTSMLFLAGGLLLLMIAVIVFFTTQVPSPEDLTNRSIAEATKITDRNGELLYNIYANENRTPVKLNDIPDHVKKATIAIEDKDFYKHKGFDVMGIVRSFYKLIIHRRIEGGGSTLTQQLVKNALLTADQSLVRKLKELILAIQVERVYTKDQILEMYLNEIPYGGTAYGIEAASNLYFGKHASELSLAESSLLAGLPQRPSVYSPYTNPDLAKSRQKEVLRRMVEDKYISQKDADQAQKQELTYRTSQKEQGFKAPHFVLYVKQKLIEQFGDRLVEQGGLRVTTTIDYKLQEKAEKIVKDEVDKLSSAKVGNGAAVVIDPETGQILSMVGSKDYFGEELPQGCIEGETCVFEPNVNVATRRRQPGSATKPITYAKGLEKGYNAAYTIMDVKTTFPGGIELPAYAPVNYDGQFHGPTQVRYALGNSFNIPAVKMLALVGIKDVMDLAYRMGIRDWEPTDENVASVGLSLTLGGRELKLLDITSAFGVFANKGNQVDPISILKVTDSKGKTLFEYKEPSNRKVLDEGIAYIISDILADNGARTAAFGSNSVLNIPGKTVAVKTGTTDNKKDNWAVGYTKHRVVGVWVGNNNNEPMSPTIASGVTGASPIWNKIMTEALKDSANEGFDKPGNVFQMEVDGLMGGKPHPGSPTRREYFVAGTEPKGESPAYQNQKVCKSNPHRLANDNEDNEQKDVVVLKEDDPTGANKWQEGIDQWVLNSPDARLVGATRGCSGIPGFITGGGGIIQIVNVGNGANVPRVFDVLASANSPAGVKKVTWLIDGAQKKTQNSEPYALHVEFPEGDKGSHTITVTLEDNNGGSFSTSIGVTISL